MRVSQRLLERRIFVPAIRPPTVPPGTSRLRVSLRAEHTLDQIDLLAGELRRSSLLRNWQRYRRRQDAGRRLARARTQASRQDAGDRQARADRSDAARRRRRATRGAARRRWLHRNRTLRKAADPWSAALAQGREPLRSGVGRCDRCARRRARRRGRRAASWRRSTRASISATSRRARTWRRSRNRLAARLPESRAADAPPLPEIALPVAGAVLVERWEPPGEAYRADVMRVLQEKVRVLGILASAPDEAESVEAGAKLFESLVNQER